MGIHLGEIIDIAFNVDLATVTNESRFADLGDSLSMVILFEQLAAAGCPVDEDSLARLATVDDLRVFLDLYAGTGDPAEAGSGLGALVGKRVALRPPDPSDYGWLYSLAHSDENIVRFRSQGTTVRPESFPDILWNAVLTQFVVSDVQNQRRLGLVSAYGADLRSGTCHISVIASPEVRLRGWPAEGFTLFLDYLFAEWPMRKIYGDATATNLPQFQFAIESNLFCVEGQLTAHTLVSGTYEDVYLLACTRESWTSWRSTRLPA